MHTLTRGFAAGILVASIASASTASDASVAYAQGGPAATGDPDAPIVTSDNQQPAGQLRNGILVVRLAVRKGLWQPEGPDGLARAVAAFAEEGGPLQNPGPLIRVPAGTEVRVSVRNSLRVPLTLYGLGRQRGVAGDAFRLEPGSVREMRFMASTPGLYYYSAITDEPWEPIPDDGIHPVYHRTGPDSQLNGVIVVDPPGAVQPARDRIFVITRWGRRDPASPTGISRSSVIVINGRSWPHTERFEVMQGDSLHWRWVNLTNLGHPMHLHGFYFRVDARGRWHAGHRIRTRAAPPRRHRDPAARPDHGHCLVAGAAGQLAPALPQRHPHVAGDDARRRRQPRARGAHGEQR